MSGIGNKLPQLTHHRAQTRKQHVEIRRENSKFVVGIGDRQTGVNILV